ncbi:hypothetical protein Airi01_088500 [Actinoallomurus iriomotensis]|uniref:Uncharacterized protein n=1 Tax=Actinoallomurus iriomotensis TaxID=478107 RepID=A0A9W6RRR9_9ACTN|nr:hypothetical protein Airi01_088500 [Actinoallomurus iriomotensis]
MQFVELFGGQGVEQAVEVGVDAGQPVERANGHKGLQEEAGRDSLGRLVSVGLDWPGGTRLRRTALWRLGTH